MKRRDSRAVLAAVIAMLWLHAGLRAEQQTQKAGKASEEDAKPTTRITVGNTTGSPGDMIVVPIYLSPAPGVEVGGLTLDISYVSVNLQFAKLDAGVTPGMDKVDLRSEVKEAKNEKGVETQTLRITGSLSSPEPPQKGISAGLLAYVTMKISEKGRTVSIALRGSAQATELGNNRPIQNLKVSDGTVDVVSPGVAEPMTTCFFFTH
jgi:hypothetical protein